MCDDVLLLLRLLLFHDKTCLWLLRHKQLLALQRAEHGVLAQSTNGAVHVSTDMWHCTTRWQARRRLHSDVYLHWRCCHDHAADRDVCCGAGYVADALHDHQLRWLRGAVLRRGDMRVRAACRPEAGQLQKHAIHSLHMQKRVGDLDAGIDEC